MYVNVSWIFKINGRLIIEQVYEKNWAEWKKSGLLGEEKQSIRDNYANTTLARRARRLLGLKWWKLKRVVNCSLPFSGSAICKQTAH